MEYVWKARKWKLRVKEKIGKVISIKKLKDLALEIENSKAAAKVGGIIGKIPVLKKVNEMSLKKRRMVFTSVFLVVVVGATVGISGFFMGEPKRWHTQNMK